MPYKKVVKGKIEGKGRPRRRLKQLQETSWKRDDTKN
jgi:hypothetical protein